MKKILTTIITAIGCIVLSINVNASASNLIDNNNVEETNIINQIIKEDIQQSDNVSARKLLLEQNADEVKIIKGQEILIFKDKISTTITNPLNRKSLENNISIKKVDQIITYAMKDLNQSATHYIQAGSVKITYYYKYDANNNNFQLLKSVFNYNISSSRFRLSSVYATGNVYGFKTDGSTYDSQRALTNYGTLTAGNHSFTQTYNYPIVKYSTYDLHFGLNLFTQYKINDLVNGTTVTDSFSINKV